MHSGDSAGYMPQLGPCWLNLYGAPRGQTLVDKHDVRADLNNGFGEGAAYRGRILVTIKGEILDENEDGEATPSGVWTAPTPSVSQVSRLRASFFKIEISNFCSTNIIDGKMQKLIATQKIPFEIASLQLI